MKNVSTKIFLLLLIVCVTITSACSAKRVRFEKDPEPLPKTETSQKIDSDPKAETNSEIKTIQHSEMRGIWFSFYDWLDLPRDEINFRYAVQNIMTQVESHGLNSIFVHVHSHSDSYYPSNFFPASKFATGTMGSNFSFDPLKIFIDEAHKRNIEFHAWLNPYRVTFSHTSTMKVTWDEIPENSIVKRWYYSSPNQRYVLQHDGKFYLNPSNDEVIQYLTDAMTELVRNYDVDGIHFDDYFYPTVYDDEFDATDYWQSGENISIAQWRRNNVSKLVRSVYNAVKSERSSVQFGISPAGNLDNLRSPNQYFVDIDRWLAEPGFVDYILPQIYWGFDLRNSDGSLSKYAFEPCLNDWLSIPRDSSVRFYVGLALYKTGRNNSEWIYNDDIIAREILMSRARNTNGFVLFDYKNLFENESYREVQNFLPLLR